MLINSRLSTDMLLQEKAKGKLWEYVSNCLNVINQYLKLLYGTDFEIQGKTILQNDGEVGNQILLTDAKLECTCTM